jgi:hypothetical protein
LFFVQEGSRSSPLQAAAGKLAETEVRRILRRVTAPANKKEAKATMKPLGRMLAKIMHAAPLPVAEQLIRQVRYYAGTLFGCQWLWGVPGARVAVCGWFDCWQHGGLTGM